MESVNYGAILVASLLGFFLGGLWYSPALFLNSWLREAKMEKMDGHSAKTFVAAYLFALIAAVVFYFFVGPNRDLLGSAQIAASVGLGWVATSFGINYQFAGRSFKLFLIDAGYHVVQFLIYGIVYGLWH